VLHPANCPQVGFIAKIRSGKQNQSAQVAFRQVFQQTWSPTSGSSLQADLAILSKPLQPPEKGGAHYTKRIRNLTDGQTSLDSVHRSKSNVEIRMPALAHSHDQTPNVSGLSSPICCNFSGMSHSSTPVA
jgi:hypothetical protein